MLEFQHSPLHKCTFPDQFRLTVPGIPSDAVAIIVGGAQPSEHADALRVGLCRPSRSRWRWTRESDMVVGSVSGSVSVRCTVSVYGISVSGSRLRVSILRSERC